MRLGTHRNRLLSLSEGHSRFGHSGMLGGRQTGRWCRIIVERFSEQALPRPLRSPSLSPHNSSLSVFPSWSSSLGSSELLLCSLLWFRPMRCPRLAAALAPTLTIHQSYGDQMARISASRLAARLPSTRRRVSQGPGPTREQCCRVAPLSTWQERQISG